MRVELLIFEGCPHAATTYDLVRRALRLEAVDAAIDVIEVNSHEAAQRMRFLGSPSVRVEGDDVESAAKERTAYGMMCRSYYCGTKNVGVPPIDMIRTAIRRAIPGR